MSVTAYKYWKHDVQTARHTLPDKRTLAYTEYGTPNGYSTFFSHGSPSSHLEGAFFHECALEYDFRIIAVDRPGIGESTFSEERKIIDFLNDILQLADSLGFQK